MSKKPNRGKMESVLVEYMQKNFPDSYNNYSQYNQDERDAFYNVASSRIAAGRESAEVSVAQAYSSAQAQYEARLQASAGSSLASIPRMAKRNLEEHVYNIMDSGAHGPMDNPEYAGHVMQNIISSFNDYYQGASESGRQDFLKTLTQGDLRSGLENLDQSGSRYVENFRVVNTATGYDEAGEEYEYAAETGEMSSASIFAAKLGKEGRVIASYLYDNGIPEHYKKHESVYHAGMQRLQKDEDMFKYLPAVTSEQYGDAVSLVGEEGVKSVIQQVAAHTKDEVPDILNLTENSPARLQNLYKTNLAKAQGAIAELVGLGAVLPKDFGEDKQIRFYQDVARNDYNRRNAFGVRGIEGSRFNSLGMSMRKFGFQQAPVGMGEYDEKFGISYKEFKANKEKIKTAVNSMYAFITEGNDSDSKGMFRQVNQSNFMSHNDELAGLIDFGETPYMNSNPDLSYEEAQREAEERSAELYGLGSAEELQAARDVAEETGMPLEDIISKHTDLYEGEHEVTYSDINSINDFLDESRSSKRSDRKAIAAIKEHLKKKDSEQRPLSLIEEKLEELSETRDLTTTDPIARSKARSKALRESPSQAAIDELDLEAAIDELGLEGLIDELDLEAAIDELDLEAAIDELGLEGLIDELDLEAAIDELGLEGLIDELDLEDLIDFEGNPYIWKDSDPVAEKLEKSSSKAATTSTRIPHKTPAGTSSVTPITPVNINAGAVRNLPAKPTLPPISVINAAAASGNPIDISTPVQKFDSMGLPLSQFVAGPGKSTPSSGSSPFIGPVRPLNYGAPVSPVERDILGVPLGVGSKLDSNVSPFVGPLPKMGGSIEALSSQDVATAEANLAATQALEAAGLTVHAVEQRSDAWHKLREENFVTGTAAKKIVQGGDKGITGLVKDATDPYRNKTVSDSNMDRGTESEAAIEEHFRNKLTGLDPDAVLGNVGFITSKDAPGFGYSPDGIITKGGVLDALAEYKSVKSITMAFDPNTGEMTDKFRDKYYDQIQLGMHLTGADKAYHTQYLEGKTKWDKDEYTTALVHRDDAWLEKNMPMFEKAQEEMAKGRFDKLSEDIVSGKLKSDVLSGDRGPYTSEGIEAITKAQEEAILRAEEKMAADDTGKYDRNDSKLKKFFSKVFGTDEDGNESADEDKGKKKKANKGPDFLDFVSSAAGGFDSLLSTAATKNPALRAVMAVKDVYDTALSLESSYRDEVGRGLDMGFENPMGYRASKYSMESFGLSEGQATKSTENIASAAALMSVGDVSGMKQIVVGTRGIITPQDVWEHGNDPAKLLELYDERADAMGLSQRERAGHSILSGLALARGNHMTDSAKQTRAERMEAANAMGDAPGKAVSMAAEMATNVNAMKNQLSDRVLGELVPTLVEGLGEAAETTAKSIRELGDAVEETAPPRSDGKEWGSDSKLADWFGDKKEQTKPKVPASGANLLSERVRDDVDLNLDYIINDESFRAVDFGEKGAVRGYSESFAKQAKDMGAGEEDLKLLQNTFAVLPQISKMMQSATKEVGPEVNLDVKVSINEKDKTATFSVVNDGKVLQQKTIPISSTVVQTSVG